MVAMHGPDVTAADTHKHLTVLGDSSAPHESWHRGMRWGVVGLALAILWARRTARER